MSIYRPITAGELAHYLTMMPADTKILLEDSDGGNSQLLTEDGLVSPWVRDVSGSSEEQELVMMLSSFEQSKPKRT